MNQWAKHPGTRPDMGTPRAMGIAPQRTGVAPPAQSPIIAQVAGINDRLVRQEALLEAILYRSHDHVYHHVYVDYACCRFAARPC